MSTASTMNLCMRNKGVSFLSVNVKVELENIVAATYLCCVINVFTAKVSSLESLMIREESE